MRTLAGIHTQQVVVAVQEYSIWGEAAEGSITGDTGVPYEVQGTKFRANANGFIVGIRWQNPAETMGNDVALFEGTTNISGIRTVTGQTSNGWQRMDFASPVAITANTIYTAAVRMGDGTDTAWRNTNFLFSSAGVTNGPLEAVATSVSSNGVYVYNSTMIAPTNNWQNTCYFVDVVYIQ